MILAQECDYIMGPIIHTFISTVRIRVDRIVLWIIAAIVVAIGRIEGIKKVSK